MSTPPKGIPAPQGREEVNTTKNVPLRVAFSVEVPGTPEQVWAAIATADGISSWFLPTDFDEREGGTIVVHMGETDSPGTITGWDPPHRLEYEPECAALTGHDVDSATPLVTEFLVEAQSAAWKAWLESPAHPDS